jgi:DNA repair exonuclease SbcCD ATPase subunit
MRIAELHAREFAKDEYVGFQHSEINGENLIIRGGNRTGKTLTFNAILYNLLGPSNTIDLSTGRSNRVGAVFTDGKEFHRGLPEAQYVDGETELTGENAQEELVSNLCEDLSDEVPYTEAIKAHFLHSHISRMPISRLSKEDRLRMIRAVVNQDTQRSIEELEGEIHSLGHQIEELKSDRRRVKEDKREIQGKLSSDKNQLENYRAIQEMIESGRLEKIVELIQNDEELEQELSELSRRREALRQELRSKQKQKSQWHRYREKERTQLIAEAVNDFVCPACGDRVDEDLAKHRMGRSRCPFCAVEDRAEDLSADVDDKISQSEAQLDEIEETIDELEEEVEEVDSKMNELRDERPELDEVDSFVERTLRQNNYQIESVVSEVESELDRYETEVEDGNEHLRHTEERVEEIEETLEERRESLSEKEEELETLRQETIEAEIAEFTSRCENIFTEIAGELALEIEVTEKGDIEIPGEETVRNYDRAGDLSDAEVTFINIAFAVSFNRFARETGLTEWNTIVMDEPFSNLDDDGVENLLAFMDDANEQFICTTSNSSYVSEFPKHGELTRQNIQASLARFGA